jgi:NAD(P)-dependent dehydrogenase (short-subunit alcohol dehydrogenase family)
MSSRVLITGGNGDIAQAIRIQLEAQGYIVYSPSHAEMDVTKPESIESAIMNFKPDILINNAGHVMPQSIRSADLERIRRHIDVNVSGTFYCTAIALKHNPNLEIINIGSAASIEVHATWSEYCASKAAIVMATRCWAEDGLYAVCISPARTRTKMRKELFPYEDQSTLLEPSDFAKVVMKAVRKEYESGKHIVVRKENVAKLLAQG